MRRTGGSGRGIAGTAAARIGVVVAGAVVAGLLAAAPRAATAPGGASERLDMRYEIYGFAGLHLVTNRTSLQLTPGHYAVAMDIQTRGVAGVVVTVQSHSEVHGRVVGDRIYPEAFRGEVVRNGVEHHNRVDYGGDGAAIGTTTPAPGDPPRLTVAADQTRGTVDQLTAYFMLERQLGRQGTCALAVPVYDGRLRYDLHFRDAGSEAVAQDDSGHYAGPTKICDMRRREIAGFPADEVRTEGAASGRIWYARLVAGELMIPVRMEFATEFGTVEGHLAELHTTAGDFRFMN